MTPPAEYDMENHAFLSIMLQSIPNDLATTCMNTLDNPNPYKIVRSLEEHRDNFTHDDHKELKIEAVTLRVDSDATLGKFFAKHKKP